ncbi:Vacuolar protein sorting-associated protein 13, partial [Gryllus bimaculatus]
MVSFQTLDPGIKLLDVLFELNPLDGKCDQRVQVSSRPLEIVYDAMSALKLADVFAAPQSQTVAQ